MTKIILGPPGTGKTTTLLDLVDDALKRGVPPDRIALVTFTTRGANEAKERAMAKFNLDSKQLPFFSTLHALCYRQLGMSRSDILTGKSFFEFADYAKIRVTGRAWSDDGIFTGFEPGDRILFMENLSRIRQVSLREQYDLDDDRIDWREVERVSKALALFKQSRGLMDFTDMLNEYVRMGHAPDIDELFVDESQDLSALQWSVVELLSTNAKNVTVAGDDDQAIYRWAGADVEHLIRMDGDVRVLGQSHRVPSKVQVIANDIINGVSERRTKKWKARRAQGTVDYQGSIDSVDVNEGDVLILARNQYVLNEHVMPALRQEGVIFEIGGKVSIDAKIMRAITTWEELRKSEAVPLHAVREMYEYISTRTGVKHGFKTLPKYGDDGDLPVTMSDLRETGGLLVDPSRIWHEALDKLPGDEMSYILSARRRGERLRGAKPRVRVSTIHSAKGGEATHVVLMKEIAQRTWYEMQRGGMDDERRVWYVGATRAKEKLTIVESETARSCPWL